MRDWRNISPGLLTRDPVLFQEFKIDYLNVIGTTFETGCKSCFESQYEKFYTKLYIMPQERKTEYRLKAMYNGIPFKGKIYNNPDLTDKAAEFLLKNHPAGEKLFDFIPTKTSKKAEQPIKDVPTEVVPIVDETKN